MSYIASKWSRGLACLTTRGLVLGFLMAWCSTTAVSQNPTEPAKSVSARTTHLLGFESASANAKGTLSIQGDALLFQRDGKPVQQVKIASVHKVFVSEQDKQVGGTAMTLGKVAAPFGGGRVISLFSHKKYDTLTLEYADSNGAVHGAVFQLNKGQAETFKTELVRSAHLHAEDNESAKKSTGVSNEN